MRAWIPALIVAVAALLTYVAVWLDTPDYERQQRRQMKADDAARKAYRRTR